jgi:hypothetical protein
MRRWKIALQLAVSVVLIVSMLGLSSGNARAMFACCPGGGGGGGSGGSDYVAVLVLVSPSNGTVNIGGATYSNDQYAVVATNTSYEISAQPNLGYSFSKWVESGVTLGSKTDQSTTMDVTSAAGSPTLTMDLVTGGYFNVTVKVSPADGAVRIVGPTPASELGLVVTNGQVAHLYSAGTYLVQALPSVNYTFGSWSGSSVDLESTASAFTNITSPDPWETHAGTLTLTLTASPWLKISFYAAGDPGTIVVWNSVDNDTENFTNGSVGYLPAGVPMTLNAQLQPGYQFDQWYAPGETLGNASNQSTTAVFVGGAPGSLALLAIPPNGALVNWTGYEANYSLPVSEAAANFTVPGLAFNPNYAGFDADVSMEGIAIGGQDNYQVMVEGGLGQWLLPNGTTVQFMFMNELENWSSPDYDFYSGAECWYPTWYWDLVVDYQAPSPPGCEVGVDGAGAGAYYEAEPSPGQTVSLQLTYQTIDDLAEWTMVLTWPSGDIRGNNLLDATAGNEMYWRSPDPAGEATWFVEIPSPYLPWDYSWIYLAPPTFKAATTFSGESVQLDSGSTTVTVPSLSGGPLSELTSAWTEPFGSDIVTYLASPLGSTGTFHVPLAALLACSTCTNSYTVPYPTSNVTGYILASESAKGGVGWLGTVGVVGSGTSINSDGTVNAEIASDSDFLSWGKIALQAGYEWSSVTVPATGYYQVLYTWSVSWPFINVFTDPIACATFTGVDYAWGAVGVTDRVTEAGPASVTVGDSSPTVEEDWSACGAFWGPAGQATITVVQELYLVHGDSYSYNISSYLSLQAFTAAAGAASATIIVQASGSLISVSITPQFILDA